MYDPERNFLMEASMEELLASTEKVKQIVGEDSPVFKLCQTLDQIFIALNQLRSDYDECYDESERKKISSQIREITEAVALQWERIERFCNE